MNEKSVIKEKKITGKQLIKQVTFEDIYELYVSKVEEKTKLQRNLIYIILAISFIFLLMGRLEIFITYTLTTIYPILWTIEDIKNKDEDVYKMWGSYWGTFFIFLVLDLLKKYFISFVPMYFIFRTIIMLFLYLPCFKGAILFYKVILVEILKFSDIQKGNYDKNDSMLYELTNKIKKNN